MFKKIFKHIFLSNKVETHKYNNLELQNLQDKVSTWNHKADIIQSKFNFILPNYIIDEIIESEEHKDFINLYLLVNCAVINNRITESDGKLIKQYYSLSPAN